MTVPAVTDFDPVGWAPAAESRVAPSRAAITSPLVLAGFATAARRLLGDAVGRPWGRAGGSATVSDGGGPAAAPIAPTAAAATGWPSAPRPWPALATVQRWLLPVTAGDRLRAALAAAAATAPGVAGRSWTAAVPTPAAVTQWRGGDGRRDGFGGAPAACIAPNPDRPLAPSAAAVVEAAATTTSGAAAPPPLPDAGGRRWRLAVGRADVAVRGATAGRARSRHSIAAVHAKDPAQVRRLTE